MTSTDPRDARLAFRPAIGRSVPIDVIRSIIAVILLALSFFVIGWIWLLAIAVLLILATLVFPRSPAAWGLAILLAIFALGAPQQGPNLKFVLALAGVHALHQFALMLGWLPDRGRLQLRILGRMLRRYLIVQIPAQLVAFAVLALLAGGDVVGTLSSPVFGLVAVGALVVLVALVVIPPLRAAQAVD